MRYSIIIEKIAFLIILMAICTTSSCKRFIEVSPPSSSITDGNVFDNDLTAAAVLTGIYSNISSRGLISPDILTISKLLGLSADEYNLWSGANPNEVLYYQNDLKTDLGSGLNAGIELWKVCYSYIYDCNQAIEGLTKSSSLSTRVKQQLIGEAKFFRSFLYFYLVNLYGDVPLIIGIDPEINRLMTRSSTATIYEFIISDLKVAQSLLSDFYLNQRLLRYESNDERVRPTKWAATALLARVYLYNSRFSDAESQSTMVINQTAQYELSSVPLNKVFLKNSKEAIWQIQPVSIGWNTTDARWFDLSASPIGFSTVKSISLSETLYNSFELGDARLNEWVSAYSTTTPSETFRFPAKYKAGSNSDITSTNSGAIAEYHMVLRLGEQYLIRAEARARQGNVAGAVADLNVLRGRARATPTTDVPYPLPELPASITQTQAIVAVMHERKVELFSEWGHRWLDLKRTGELDSVMGFVTPIKGGSWETSDKLFPIPADDLSRNPNLIQNPGY